MSAGDDEANQGEGWPGTLGQPVGVDVALQVIHAGERPSMGQSDSLGHIYPDEQRAGQTGADGHGHAVQIRPGNISFSHRLLEDGDDGQNVLAGSYFRDNSAIAGVDFDLRGNLIGENLNPVFDHRGRGLITRGLNAENLHISGL